MAGAELMVVPVIDLLHNCLYVCLETGGLESHSYTGCGEIRCLVYPQWINRCRNAFLWKKIEVLKLNKSGGEFQGKYREVNLLNLSIKFKASGTKDWCEGRMWKAILLDWYFYFLFCSVTVLLKLTIIYWLIKLQRPLFEWHSFFQQLWKWIFLSMPDCECLC